MKLRIKSHSLHAVAAVLLLSPAGAQVPGQLKHPIQGPPVGLANYGYLGYSVAVDGSYAVVGLPYEFTAGNFSGIVKVFDPVSGAVLFEFPNPSPEANDGFGSLVAIAGSRVVVGASARSIGIFDSSRFSPQAKSLPPADSNNLESRLQQSRKLNPP